MRVLGLPNFMETAIVAVAWIPLAGFDNVLWRRHCHSCVIAVTRRDIQDDVARQPFVSMAKLLVAFRQG